jgi:predicted nicotinamide N-methyase
MCKAKGMIPENANISTTLLNWKNWKEYEGNKWDVVIGSDCLFFTDFHDDLVSLLFTILAADGVALLLQPRRHGTMEQFIDKAKGIFNIEIIEEYSELVSDTTLIYTV